ncbi:SLAC1 anion channel family protein [Cohnella lupini]|uniref:SLAC1 anion channel family protein n=1 Tax=Cohnella lupini TaxID=1294267 RepID=UPI001FE827C3|nr:SLAC1 anion channel family protein [Cohnella lupini]
MARHASRVNKIGSIQNLPVNLFGSVMGISGLALAWRLSHTVFGTPNILSDICGWIAIVAFIVLVFCYAMKAIRYPAKVASEFAHPILGNFFGTIAVSLLLLSTVIGSYSSVLSETIWILGAIFTFILAFLILSRVLKGSLVPSNVVPAWLIPGVATLDIAVAGGTMPFEWTNEINILSMAIGGFVALVFFGLIISRLIHHEPMPAALTPSLMILIAPFEVGFLGYTNYVQKIDPFASILFYFGLFMFLVLLSKVFRKSVPFGPTWWALSFPIAALVNAALKYAIYMDSWIMDAIAIILLAFLTFVICYLFIRTLMIVFNGKLLGGV